MKKLNNTSKPKVPTQDQIHAMKYLQVLKRLANEYAEKKSAFLKQKAEDELKRSTQNLNDSIDTGKSK